MPPLITLTTDFEEREPYVAEVKGILYSRCPGVTVVDLSHQIARASVLEAALFLAGAVSYFPDNTVHLIAVASGARPIAVALGTQFAICPDNGVLTLLAERLPVKEVRTITNPKIDLSQANGQIYYARDVFAPAAAHFALQGSIREAGERIDDCARLGLPRAQRTDEQTVQGQIMHVNRFGSLVTNIHRSLLDGCEVTKIAIADFRMSTLSKSYTDVDKGLPVALMGSTGYLEVAYRGDRADKKLNLREGIRVIITVKPGA